MTRINKNILDPIDNESVVDKIVNRITDGIISGDFKPGEKIPTEIELSESLGVGRNSVREAIKILVSLGVLKIKRSEGTFVTQGFSDKMLNPLLYGLILEDGSSESLIELRRIFEVGTLQLAVQNRNEEDLKQIKEKYQDMCLEVSNGLNDSNKILKADIDFHNALGYATHNKLVVTINSVITKLTIPSRLKTTKRILDEKMNEFIINTHKRMLDTVEKKEISEIINVVEESYVQWEDSFKSKE